MQSGRDEGVATKGIMLPGLHVARSVEIKHELARGVAEDELDGEKFSKLELADSKEALDVSGRSGSGIVRCLQRSDSGRNTLGRSKRKQHGRMQAVSRARVRWCCLVVAGDDVDVDVGGCRMRHAKTSKMKSRKSAHGQIRPSTASDCLIVRV